MRKELLPGEQVIVVTRRQPRMLILPVLVFILVPAIAAYLAAWITKGGVKGFIPLVTAAWTPWLLLACLLLATWALLGYTVPRVLKWRSVRYFLTNRRIIARFGMLRRSDWQVPLAAIRNVGVHQSILQRVLRSGNISLDTGHDAALVMADVPEAATFRAFVLDAIGELPDGGDFGEWQLREGGGDER
ncbi:PH domain-containing protein [Arthrobacter sp. M4]|uniref:PH domain-containing protein n=1 Tax=Arthrobacter sp. M4 TaxID=218160 RepID=UPI001CDB9BB4|nr:PH domain-containing protein [Arthrobacter sp. M4]MCA4133661.1 PH domain-containing protein [Arthrobacter sp. M4]